MMQKTKTKVIKKRKLQKDGSYKKTKVHKDESYQKTKVTKGRKLAKNGSYYEPRAAGLCLGPGPDRA